MMKLLSAFCTLFLAIFAIAGNVPHPKTCSTSKAKLVLPDGQNNFTNPSFVLLGVGYQNYTCGATGRYTSAGALAHLYDLSCLSKVNNQKFETIQDTAAALWSAYPKSLDDFSKKAQTLGVHKLGDHFFQPGANGSIAPVWDFRGDSAPNQPTAFVVAARVAGFPAPTGPQDIDWLQLRSVSGDLATSIYRTHTKGGQPPASCSGSDRTQVKYVSKYWLYGGTITVS